MVYLINKCKPGSDETLPHPEDKVLVRAENEDQVEEILRKHGFTDAFFISGPLKEDDIDYKGWVEMGIPEIK